jgi:hypothetical protein
MSHSAATRMAARRRGAKGMCTQRIVCRQQLLQQLICIALHCLHCRKLAASSAAVSSSAGGGSGRLTRGLAGTQSRASFPTARDLGISIDDPNDDFADAAGGVSPLRQPQEAESPVVARSMGATGELLYY